MNRSIPRRVLAVLVFLGLTVCLVSAGGTGETGSGEAAASKTTQTQAAGAAAKIPDKMVIVTSASTGTWLAAGTALAELLGKYANTRVTPQTTTGSVENIRLLSYGDAELGFAIITDLTKDAYNGTGPFKGEKIENVRAVFGAFPSAVQILVRKESGIRTVRDLAGKKVNTGPAGTYGSMILKWLFESYGLSASSYNEVNQGWTDSYEAVGDGDLDCVFAVGAYPNSGMASLATTKDLYFVPLTEADIAMLKTKDDTFYKTFLPAGTYPGQDKEVLTIANPAGLIVPAKMDDEVVYAITKLVYEHVSEFQSYSPLVKFIKPEAALSGVPLAAVHPGAMRYFKETNNPGLMK